MDQKHKTRLIVNIDNEVSYSCGLNHLGYGNFYIIVASRYIKALNKKKGDIVSFKIQMDPNPLGADIPEVLAALIAQDEEVRYRFKRLTDGKKCSLIYYMRRVKDIDKQVQRCLDFLNGKVGNRSKHTDS